MHLKPKLSTMALGAGAAALAAGGWLLKAHHSEPGRTARTDVSTGHGGTTRQVVTADGTVLHVEIDGPEDAEVSVVFVHGWLMDLTTWHRQRDALADSGVRRVFYDHRGHGHSTWEGMDSTQLGVRQLAEDLMSVIAATAPTGRVVLVGHSMGGMTIMALAHVHPELIEERIAGVLLVATGAGPLEEQLTLGIPDSLAFVQKLVRANAVGVIASLGRLPRSRVRSLGIGPAMLATRLVAAAPGAADDVIAITTAPAWRNRFDVAAVAMAAASSHDERTSVHALGDTAVVTINPGRDRLIPPTVQRDLVALIPGARMVEVPASGHMVMLEAPEVVTGELNGLLAVATASA